MTTPRTITLRSNLRDGSMCMCMVMCCQAMSL